MNILEEYLVKIGAEVDTNSFNGATRAINQLADALRKLTAAFKVTALLTALAKLFDSVVGNIKAVADLDMQYQKLANSMWVTKDTAKSLKIAMDTMGASQEDIAWIPELREQFFRLREEMAALATPEDADGQLLWIRQIGYDVQSLQVKFKMLREWITYYLIKYLKPYIEEFQKFIQWLSKQLGDKMPTIAKKFASVVRDIFSLGASVFRLFKNIFVSIYDFVERIPTGAKKLVLVFAAVGAAIMMSPFGLMLTALGGAILLLQDFFYYMDGKKSSKTLAPMWEKLIKFSNGAGGSFLNTIKKTISDCIDLLANFYDNTGKDLVNLFVDGAKKVYEYLKMTVDEIDLGGVIDGWRDSVLSLMHGVKDLFNAFVRLLKKVDIDGNGVFGKFFKGIGRALSFAIKQWFRMMGFIGKIMSAVAAAMDGNFKQAATILGFAVKSLITGTIKGVANMFNGGNGAVAGGGNSKGADRAAQLVAEQPQNLLNNPNGCTFFVQTALGKDDGFMKELNGNLWVPDWVDKAKESGRFNYGMEGMKKGDIIVVDYGTDDTEGDHVIMYDGEGGYYGNSTKRKKPVHGSLSDFGNNAIGYIRTGEIYGGVGGGYEVNPNSYAAKGGANVDTPALAGGYGASQTYNNSSQRFGNIIINIDGSKDPKATAEAVRNVFNNPTPYLNANRAQTGGVG